MAFITNEDFPASIHEDILNALTKGDNKVITDNIGRAVDEVRSYMNGRYDNQIVFSQTGDDRNLMIVRLCVTIATYYIFLQHNPRKVTSTMAADYQKAIEDCEKIRRGVINPEGLPAPTATPPGSTSGTGAAVQWGSACALESSY